MRPYLQRYQGSQGLNPTARSGSPALPLAYTLPQNGNRPRPGNLTIQSHAANSQAHPPPHPHNEQLSTATTPLPFQIDIQWHKPRKILRTILRPAARQTRHPRETPQGNAPVPVSGPAAGANNAESDAQERHGLAEDSKPPMAEILLCDPFSGVLQHVQ